MQFTNGRDLFLRADPHFGGPLAEKTCPRQQWFGHLPSDRERNAHTYRVILLSKVDPGHITERLILSFSTVDCIDPE